MGLARPRPAAPRANPQPPRDAHATRQHARSTSGAGTTGHNVHSNGSSHTRTRRECAWRGARSRTCVLARLTLATRDLQTRETAACSTSSSTEHMRLHADTLVRAPGLALHCDRLAFAFTLPQPPHLRPMPMCVFIPECQAHDQSASVAVQRPGRRVAMLRQRTLAASNRVD